MKNMIFTLYIIAYETKIYVIYHDIDVIMIKNMYPQYQL